MFNSALVAAAALSSITAASPLASTYKLDKTYDASNFFSSFDFMEGPDKWTHGFANYQSSSAAQSSGLAKIQDGKVFLGADSTTTVSPDDTQGRPSIRLEGHDEFNSGLLVADFDHIPAAGCGMWPAFWTVYDSATYSEIDLLESVSLSPHNEITMYSSDQCTVTDQSTGLRDVKTDCHLPASGPGGCGGTAPDGTFGEQFNAKGGGVWALQLEADTIKAWYFAKADVPADLATSSPNPDGWSAPVMSFVPNSCNILDAFKKMHIVINITFCGSYAGEVWANEDNNCAAKTGYDTCEAYVREHPEAFADTNFVINNVRTFTRA